MIHGLLRDYATLQGLIRYVRLTVLPVVYFCVPTPGRFIPSCDEDGYYRKQQCDRGECWCVDQNGGEVAGSRIRGKPDCGESHRFQLSIYMKRILT